MRTIILALFFGTFLTSCDEVDALFGRNKHKAVSYSFSCLDSAVGGKSINRHLDRAGDLIRDLAVSEKSITDSMQTAYGILFHEQIVKEGNIKFVTDRAVVTKVNKVLEDLLAARDEPSKISYAAYVFQDTTINAFTFGGRIYFTTAMLDKCRGKEDLLYAIMGHEIGHSEVGHIRTTIQELELSNRIFGEQGGSTFYQLKSLLTASFNQRNELEADYYGINLTNELGYDVCSAVKFWKEMASKENQYSEVEDFFRTHPFSDLRADCLTSHIRTNFERDCGNLSQSNSLPQVMEEPKP